MPRGRGIRSRSVDNKPGGRHCAATPVPINDALPALETVDPALAEVAELRYFAGYSETEVAEQLGCSGRTVRRQ